MKVYYKIPYEEIKAYVDAFMPKLIRWFADNPKRKICKVDWFYGRSLNLHRNNYRQRITNELQQTNKGG